MVASRDGDAGRGGPETRPAPPAGAAWAGAASPASGRTTETLAFDLPDGPPGGGPLGPERFLHLEHVVTATAAAARRLRTPLLASWVAPVPPTDPLSLYARAGKLTALRFFWSDPLGGEGGHRLVLVGAGAAGYVRGRGRGRFRSLRDGWRHLIRHLGQETAPPRGAGPILVGGAAFDPPEGLHRENDRGSGWQPGEPPAPGPGGEAGGPWAPFGDGLLVVPRLLVTSRAGSSWLTLNAWVPPEADPRSLSASLFRQAVRWLEPGGAPAASDGDEGRGPGDGGSVPTGGLAAVEGIDPGPWRDAVAAAAGAVRQGRVRKVVVARAARVRRAGGFDGGRVLAALAAANPRATLFALEVHGSTFLGATPERLARVEDGWVTSMALAGSAPRGRGRAEDDLLGRELLASGKNREEHQAVVDALREGLAPLTDRLEVAPEPGLLRLPTVQHLHTPIRGRLAPGATLLDVVERLHPTPAVGGWPRREALRLLRELEGWNRGWYAGPVGWVDPHGDGAFAVAIRSGLLRGREARLFAGCGVVAASEPASEYREWQLKLRPMLEALEGAVP